MINTNSRHTPRQENYHQTVDKAVVAKNLNIGKTDIRYKVHNIIHTNSGYTHNEENYHQTVDKSS